ncbi:MAG: ABC-2 family transporter protein [Candidatus Amesbacteria bacterium]|nr:ABC-2 family transporter protein [Candidatus Amesbacteria bacterium]
MRKYWAFCKITWQQTIAYRGESIVWFILEAIPMVYMMNLWISLQKFGRISTDTAGWLITYQFLTLCIARLTAHHFDDWVIDDIKDGSISKNLLKPFSFKGYLMANELTWRISGLIYLIPTFLVLIPVRYLLSTVHLQFQQLLFVIILLITSFFQRFFVSYMITLAAYWFDQASFLIHLKWMFEGMFGGAWLPIEFFPMWLRIVSSMTPFYFWFTLPIRGLIQPIPISEQLIYVSVSILWVLLLYVLSRFLEKRALLKYSATGN